RLRPILMTSFAFILGVVPLLLGTGAGAEMRRTLGVAVFSGMLGVTFFGIFLTPVFFYVIEWFVEQPLFSSARMRLVGKVLLCLVGGLPLGLFWIVPLVLRTALRRSSARATAARKQPVPIGNGDGVGRDGVKVISHREAASPNGRPHQSANGDGA